jgi:hypothetical protein
MIKNIAETNLTKFLQNRLNVYKMTCSKFLKNRQKKRNPTQKQPTTDRLFLF